MKEFEDYIDDVVEDLDDEVIIYINVRLVGSVSRLINNIEEEEEEGNVLV